jgi:hypothetical protein
MTVDYSDYLDPRSPLEVNYDGNVITGYSRRYVGGQLQDAPDSFPVRKVIEQFVANYNSPVIQQRINLMRDGGWISKGTKSPATIISTFSRVLGMAQGSNKSVDEILFESASVGDATRSGGGGGGPFRSETTSVTEYDATNVTDIANNAARQRLGRAATKKERELLATALNEAQRKSPMVTISEGTTAGGTMSGADGQRTARGTVSTTTQRGGIDAAEIAAEQTVKAEDFEERFFVSTFTDMLKDLAKPAV